MKSSLSSLQNRTATIMAARPAGVPRVLDPHGIYGTRSQTRRHQAQRRRFIHNGSLFLLFLFVLLGAWAWWRVPRVAWWSPAWSLALSSPVCAAATETTGAAPQLWVPLESGQIARVDLATQRLQLLPLSGGVPAAPQVSGAQGFSGGDDGTLRAFDINSGRLGWNYASGGAISAQSAVFTLPAKGEAALQSIVVGGNDAGEVFALPVDGGRQLWAVRLDGPVGNGIVGASDGETVRVLVPVLAGTVSRGGLRALDGRTGKTLWRYPNDARIYAAQVAPPLLVKTGATTAVICADDAGSVAVLDARNGQRLSKSDDLGGWKTFVAPLPTHPRDLTVSLRLTPILVRDGSGSSVVVAGNDGGVRALDGATGRTLWTFAAGAPVAAMIGATPNLLAMVDDQGRGTLLDARNGHALRRWQAPEASGGRYFLATAKEQLFCLGGTQLQSFALSAEIAP